MSAGLGSTRRTHGPRGRRLGARLVAAVTGGLVALAMLSVVAPTPAAAAPDDGVLRVLLFYKTNFHASHVQARQAIRDLTAELADEYGEEVDIQETDNPAVFNDENLATVDTLAFAQTGGVLFDDEQREALETYIRGGGGFMGLHYTAWSVGESEHDVNPFYLDLVGAMSEGHPENPAVRPGRVVNADPTHPLTEGLPAEITRSDEWYDWTFNPAPDVRTLLEADESSYGMGRQGSTHPITWCQEIDAGRSWYTAMGHEGSAYSEPFMLDQMREGLAYSSGLKAADCSPPAKSDSGSWGGVEPWPLMAINASLTPDGTVQSFGSVPTGCTDATPYDWTGNGCISQGGQFEYDVWDPSEERTLDNLRDGVSPNETYTDLFCAMQVQQPHTGTTMTVGGDDGLGENAPNDGAIGVTSYSAGQGMQNEAPMHYPRWYPTGTTMPNGDIVVQGGSLRGGPGGPGVKTPEIYTPDSGSGWRLLEGAESTAAYGDGGSDHAGQDENRWWYPRAFVTPGSGTLFNVTGTQMYELDPYADSGAGQLTLRGTLPAGVANQGPELGNPVGATSTSVMYEPGKILQVGGGWWANGGGPAGARGGMTIDITGGADAPQVTASEPMEYRRHWPTGTVMPDGRVIVTGGSSDNNGNAGYVTNPEIWDPETGDWTTVDVPHEHARLYHSTALLVPDGRIMIGGGGAPGPRNYTDVEYYSPSYLFDGDEPAVRPEITAAPDRIGYAGTFDVESSEPVERVTLVRNGSVTHGFNNDQNFQELDFTQDSSGQVRITAPQDATYAPPGAYMLFVWNADGTPSEAKIVDIDPEVELDVRTPLVVDQFEYPRVPAEWQSNNPPAVVPVGPDNARMSPWTVADEVQLVRGTAAGQGGLGGTGYQLGLGGSGSLERSLRGLQAGEEYRIALKYARDSRSAGSAPATADLAVGDLEATLSATTDNPSGDQSGGSYATYVGTFTAPARSTALSLSATGGAGMMLDDLVVTATDPGLDDAEVRYELDEGEGTSAANSGTDASVGAATLTGGTGWSPDGVFGAALDLPGGSNDNAVDLPDDLLAGETDFSTAFWVQPDELTDWTGLFHLGTGLGGDGGFFQIQTQTQADGATGLAATFKAPGEELEERVYATPPVDLEAGGWNHVAFVREGATGTLFLDGEPVASRDDLTIGLDDIGATDNNWLGRNGFGDPAFDGRMDDVRAYGSALGEDDVAALYADGAALRTETSITVDPVSPSPFGEPLTISAAVDAEGDAVAEGTAQLFVDGSPAAVAAAVEDDGTVTFDERTLGRGDHELRVVFEGADGFRDSEATTTHTVERPPPGEGTPIHYTFDEGEGRTAANTGTDTSVGDATLEGATGWTPDGQYDAGVSLPGGGSGTGNQVRLPNDIQAGIDEDFSVSIWTRPDALPNWVPLLQIGSSTDTFFLLQSSTQVSGPTGFAATFKAAGNATQDRLTLGGGTDTPVNEWTHVVFTMSGSTGRIYFDGELVGEKPNFTLGMDDVGVGGSTTANFVGGTSWPDPRYDGLVDDLRMYDYELSEEQVGELYEGEPEDGAPVAVDDAYATDQDEALTVDAPGVLGNDTDADGDELSATGATQPANGELELAEDGSFVYTPDEGWAGVDSFTYAANDGTSDSAPATVRITVEEADDPDPPGDDAPVAVADVYSTDQDTDLTVEAPGVLGNDTVAEGSELTAVQIGRPRRGEVELAEDGSFVYTPPPGFSGTDQFAYLADDGTSQSNLTTVTIAVDEVPPAVTAVAGVAAPYAYGRVGTVVASVAPRTATGRVEVLDGERVLAGAVLADGRAQVRLPAGTLRPGAHQLTLRYVGDARHAASSTSVDVEVAKASPQVRVQLPAAVDRGQRAALGVRVTAPGVSRLYGKVRVAMQGKRAVTRWLDARGRVDLRLPRANRAGQVRVRVVYLGSGLADRAERTVTMRVRR